MGGKIEKFEDLVIWQEGRALAVRLYQILSECRDYGLRDQMQRAAVSIPSNIAEGFERQSNKEFMHFLHIAKASCAELRTQIYIAMDLGIIAGPSGNELLEMTRAVSAKVAKLILVRKENF
jgi:four helix bundle protein